MKKSSILLSSKCLAPWQPLGLVTCAWLQVTLLAENMGYIARSTLSSPPYYLLLSCMIQIYTMYNYSNYYTIWREISNTEIADSESQLATCYNNLQDNRQCPAHFIPCE